ncbi:hypothetical protein HDU97_010044 [Phlyctochytrium planicorne]|nr:hypothetical protein HDU97_010044 [Phlyctochytrium planicorne]
MLEGTIDVQALGCYRMPASSNFQNVKIPSPNVPLTSNPMPVGDCLVVCKDDFQSGRAFAAFQDDTNGGQLSCVCGLSVSSWSVSTDCFSCGSSPDLQHGLCGRRRNDNDVVLMAYTKPQVTPKRQGVDPGWLLTAVPSPMVFHKITKLTSDSTWAALLVTRLGPFRPIPRPPTTDAFTATNIEVATSMTSAGNIQETLHSSQQSAGAIGLGVLPGQNVRAVPGQNQVVKELEGDGRDINSTSSLPSPSPPSSGSTFLHHDAVRWIVIAVATAILIVTLVVGIWIWRRRNAKSVKVLRIIGEGSDRMVQTLQWQDDTTGSTSFGGDEENHDQEAVSVNMAASQSLQMEKSRITNPELWSVSQICAGLLAVGVSIEALNRFRAGNLSIQSILELTDARLAEMGISSPLERQVVLRGIERIALRMGNDNRVAENNPPEYF